jgi:hypothetical protein
MRVQLHNASGLCACVFVCVRRGGASINVPIPMANVCGVCACVCASTGEHTRTVCTSAKSRAGRHVLAPIKQLFRQRIATPPLARSHASRRRPAWALTPAKDGRSVARRRRLAAASSSRCLAQAELRRRRRRGDIRATTPRFETKTRRGLPEGKIDEIENKHHFTRCAWHQTRKVEHYSCDLQFTSDHLFYPPLFFHLAQPHDRLSIKPSAPSRSCSPF